MFGLWRQKVDIRAQGRSPVRQITSKHSGRAPVSANKGDACRNGRVGSFTTQSNQLQVRPCPVCLRSLPNGRAAEPDENGQKQASRVLLKRQESNLHEGLSPRDGEKVLNVLISRSLLCFSVQHHMSALQGRAAACPRAARKSGTYRSHRFLQVAAQVPSAGTISLQVGCLRRRC
jgi:hypothetical protein